MLNKNYFIYYNLPVTAAKINQCVKHFQELIIQILETSLIAKISYHNFCFMSGYI